MAIHAFIDDSGTEGKGQGPVFVLAGFLAPSEAWNAFSEAWQGCLNEAPTIRYFKMREAARLNGEFKRWSKDARDAKVRKLARIVGSHAEEAIWCVVDLKNFESFAPEMQKPFNEAYFWPFYLIIMSLANSLYHRGVRERFDITFDEHVIFGPRALAWYPTALQCMEPEVRTIMPLEPRFRKDYAEAERHCLPLQAADMFAWLSRRVESESPNPFEWIREELTSIRVCPASHDFSKAEMKQILDEHIARHDDPEGFAKMQRERVERFRAAMGLPQAP